MERSSTGDAILDRRFEWAQGSLAAGDCATAADLLAGITAARPDWAPGWFHLGKARSEAAKQAASAQDDDGACEAATALQRYLALDPADRLGAGLLLASLGAADQADAMSPAYVATLFDAYAARFEAHLTGTLGYAGPALLMAALRDACTADTRPFHFASVIDLGCGTGLMARALAAHADTITGVDLSARMLDEARRTGLYTALAQADAAAFLAESRPAVALIVAADVLVYLGDLRGLFRGAVASLTARGLFAFTAQHKPGEGFALNGNARYAHSETYIRQCATQHGLRVAVLRQDAVRSDRGTPEPSLIVVLERP